MFELAGSFHMKQRSEPYLHRFLQDPKGSVIVLPSPYGAYKRGISYNDACATGELYSWFRGLDNVDVRTPESVGLDVNKNLVLLGGKKANPLTKEFQCSRKLNR